MDAGDLTAALDRLVADGVVTRGQADAVVEAVRAQRPRRRISPAAEIVGYIGGVLATVAAITVASNFWEQLSTMAQFGLFAVTAVLLWGAGRLVIADDDPAAGRLGGALWLLSTTATAAAAWTAGSGVPGLDDDVAALLLGLVTTAHASVLWRLRTSSLQQIGLFAGVAITVGAALALYPGMPDGVAAVIVWALGLGWAALSWRGSITPRRTGAVLGSVTAVVGAEGLAFAHEGWGVVLTLATIGLLFAAAAVTGEVVYIAVASITLAFALPQALQTWFPGSMSAATAVFLAGIVLLGGALVTVRAARRKDATPEAG